MRLASVCLILGLLLMQSRCSGINGPSLGGNGSGSGTMGAGDSARDYLATDSYTSLVVEIQAVSGYRPSATAQTNLVNFLATYLNKPGGVTIHLDADIAPPGKTTYSIADVQSIEASQRTLQSAGTQAVAYFLFLDGNSTSDSSSGQILGQAYAPSSLVIYEKTIQNLSGAIGQPSRAVLESTVMQHEFGHILGLVNIGTPMQSAHQDTAHGAHCTNTACLMYWQVDTSNFVANLLGGTVPTLDSGCTADLHANGGK